MLLTASSCCLCVTLLCRYVKYEGRKDKTHQGGLRQRKVAFKNVKHYEGTEGVDMHFLTGEQQQKSTTPIQGVADLISVYRGCVSQFADDSGDARFYHRALANDVNGMPRFSKQPVGRNTLAKIVPDIAAAAGMKGNYTSHTPKASCAMQLYDQGVDEQLIMERTGHRSVEAVRVYKRTTEGLVKTVSGALEPSAKRQRTSTQVQPLSETTNVSAHQYPPISVSCTQTQHSSEVGEFNLQYCNVHIHKYPSS